MQRNKIVQRMKSLPPVAYMLVVLIVIFSVMSPNYLTLMNFKNVLIQATPLMIVAFGQTCIVLTQGTDLSLGAQVSFVTVFTVWMALRGIPLPAAMLLAVLSTTLIGVANGVIVAKGSIPPFIATYGMQNILNSPEALKRIAALTGQQVQQLPSESMKMAMTVIATGPIVLLYPFLQKYFVKGLTIGAVKG